MNDWVVEVKDFEEEILEDLYTLLNENGINKVKDLINLKNKQIQELTNNWNELEEYLKGLIDNFDENVSAPIMHEQMTIKIIYDYMKEIKENNK